MCLQKRLVMPLLVLLLSPLAEASQPPLFDSYKGGRPWYFAQSGSYPEENGVNQCEILVTRKSGKKLVFTGKSYSTDILEPLDSSDTPRVATSMKVSEQKILTAMAAKNRFFLHHESWLGEITELEITLVPASQKVWNVRVKDRLSWAGSSDEVSCQILIENPNSPPAYDRTPGKVPAPL